MEELAGYSRAVRHGSRIVVSGTGDLAGDGTIGHPGDTYAQARAAFERAVAAVERLGGGRDDLVRTRVFLTPEADWRDALRAHKELFDSVRPANTTVIVAGFPAPGMLVEVEVDAELSERNERRLDRGRARPRLRSGVTRVAGRQPQSGRREGRRTRRRDPLRRRSRPRRGRSRVRA